jgi:hypothetical protein
MTEVGKREVKETSIVRSEALAERLSSRWRAGAAPSRGTLKGIAHLTHTETAKDKLAKAAKDVIKEDEEGATPAQSAPKTAPATAPKAANDNSTPPPPHDTHTEGGGGH